MVVEIAAGKIIARPGQQLVKRAAIVRRKGKEQGVALPFRGRNFARVAGINDTPALTDVILFKLLPGRRYRRREEEAPPASTLLMHTSERLSSHLTHPGSGDDG